jgi:ribonuclease E
VSDSQGLVAENDSQPVQDAIPGAAETGDGPTRRRRRGGRGGRGGGDRGERAPRESFAEGASPANATESQAARHESTADSKHEPHIEREPAPARERPEPGNAMPEQHAHSEDAPMYDPRNDDEDAVQQHQPVREPAPEQAPMHEPKLAYSSSALQPPRGFQVISEHDAAEEEARRPQRKRREAARDAAQAPELQLVETQAEAAPIPAEDDTPRRTKPRRRRSGAAEAEPLKLVETQPGAEPPHVDGAPVP